ncbi:Ribosome-associated heat shock protein [Candidatus Arthromitus sp. SFB-mouse-NL]|uniref:RNA-binding S4 domain-containing protein n=1 Tax=Candidatus Arthromitus sp. SFB-mouse-NL TaxID=1508644 RepID=UPI00049A0DB9|nr:RNA-binding S4 domain-containing protein [Candidatus Arthromitus sp. SFB-mouse-NL]AID45474.1 Ribosome-associated heat shock protein [Candidatus Arthromitus sp. SFB-mouse-NL]
MRLDKFLKVTRIIKRRTVAKDACDSDKVLINGKLSKPSSKVNVGDVLEIIFGNNNFKIEILDIKEHVRKDEAEKMYRII